MQNRRNTITILCYLRSIIDMFRHSAVYVQRSTFDSLYHILFASPHLEFGETGAHPVKLTKLQVQRTLITRHPLLHASM